ncbi:MAG: M67 family metallopeptidase [Pseudomonadota bacterium]
MKIEVTREALDAIRCAAAEAGEKEACGLLLGTHEQGRACITQALETRNTHPTPHTHFEVEPKALIDAYRAEREGAPRVLGYFHSHPQGEAVPSETDQSMAPRDGRVWAIASRSEVRFWKDKPEGFAPLDVEITDPEIGPGE